MKEIAVVDRRTFLGGLVSASALLLGARIMPSNLQAASDAESAAWSPGIFLGIEPDGTAIIVAHRSEMGTGIRTALPAVVADELDADWSKVRIEQATQPTPSKLSPESLECQRGCGAPVYECVNEVPEG